MEPMEMNEKNRLSALMEASMSKVREMVDSNSIIGEPITTPDGVTLIPISRLSYGYSSGGTEYGVNANKFAGGAAGGFKVEPVAFLVVKDGVTRMLPVGAPATNTVDRVIDLVPEVMERVERFVERRKEAKEEF